MKTPRYLKVAQGKAVAQYLETVYLEHSRKTPSL
jgi:hypothetical protein